MSDLAEHPRAEQIEAEAARVAKVVAEGLAVEYGGSASAELRLDTFVVVPVFVWEEDDTFIESATVWGESRRNHVHRGILDAGLEAARA